MRVRWTTDAADDRETTLQSQIGSALGRGTRHAWITSSWVSQRESGALQGLRRGR